MVDGVLFRRIVHSRQQEGIGIAGKEECLFLLVSTISPYLDNRNQDEYWTQEYGAGFTLSLACLGILVGVVIRIRENIVLGDRGV